MVNLESDPDPGAEASSAVATLLAGSNAILLISPEVNLPPSWALPWTEAGWEPKFCKRLGDLSKPKVLTDRRLLLVAVGNSESSQPEPEPEPAVVERRHGRLRRSDFLADLAHEIKDPRSDWPVLIAIRVDQASSLSERLGQAAEFELEQCIAERFACELDEDDAYTLWLEFGFGVLVHRDHSEQIIALAERICTCISQTPFDVAGEPCLLTVSVGLALLPKGPGADNPDRWFASAHAAQGIAQRHGGNRHDGVISHEFDGIPAERVLIIREWVREATTGQNIQIEFQPLHPLRSDTSGLYMVHAKLRDFRAPLGGVYRPEYLSLARDAGSMIMIDRVSLFEAFGALGQMRAQGRDTRMLVPVEISTLDGIAWRWLEAELHRHRHLAHGLIVLLEAVPELAEPDGQALLAKVRDAGAAVALADRSGRLDRVSLWARIPADLLCLSHAVISTCAADEFSERVAPWQAVGRQIIVDKVTDFAALPHLTKLGIDYLQERSLTSSGPRPDFEFSLLD